jgi:hypothetical protein
LSFNRHRTAFNVQASLTGGDNGIGGKGCDRPGEFGATANRLKCQTLGLLWRQEAIELNVIGNDFGFPLTLLDFAASLHCSPFYGEAALKCHLHLRQVSGG